MRRYLWFGTGALVLMIPLALTSTDAHGHRGSAPKRWKRLHRLAYVVAIGARHPLLPAGEVRRAPAAGVRRRGRRCCWPIAWSRTTSACGQRRAPAGPGLSPRAATSPKKKFWSGELLIARIFDETPDVKTFRLDRAGRRPAAVHAHGRSVPEPGAHHRRQARQPLLHDRLVADAQRVLRDLGEARRRWLRLAAPARDVARRAAREGVGAGGPVRLRRPRGRARRAHRRRHRHHADDVDRPQPHRPRLAGRDLPAVLRQRSSRTSCFATSSPISSRGFRTCTCVSSCRAIPIRHGTARADRSPATSSPTSCRICSAGRCCCAARRR